VIELGTLDVRGEDDVVRAHQTVRTTVAELGFTSFEQTRIATATSEIARNALTYAGSGTVSLSVDDDARTLVVSVVDRGPGIADIAGAMRGQRRAGGEPGNGIRGSRRLVDDLTIDSTPAGTRVVLTKRLPRTVGAVGAAALGRLRARMADQLADDPTQEIRRLQSDIAERDTKLGELALELADTNRGVMALYAELEQRAELQRRATELKARLLSEMGHELRTPLHSMLSISQFLIDRLDGPLTNEQDKQVRIIHEIAGTLSVYINDLLDLTRVDAGKTPVRPSSFTAEAVMNTLRRMMAPITSPDVSLRFTTPPGLPPLYTDETKLSQILRNLVANALKFTERGQVTVRAFAGEDEHVVFEVQDSGVGIAPEHHLHIFEEFAQVEGALQRRTRGTGLGLPLRRRYAELLGGRIELVSAVSEGSTFRLILPVQYEGEVGTVTTAATDVAVATRPTPGQPRLLIIDDDEASRYVLRRWLAGRYRISEALGGIDGLRAAAAERPDAIFLDVVMPDLTGFEVLERLGANPVTAGIPVIVYTSLVLGAGDRQRLSRAAALVRKSTASRVADRSAIERALLDAGVAIALEPIE
jgi:signal transduction histidine kinase/CheY-like chemotaxis protein